MYSQFNIVFEYAQPTEKYLTQILKIINLIQIYPPLFRIYKLFFLTNIFNFMIIVANFITIFIISAIVIFLEKLISKFSSIVAMVRRNHEDL